MQSIDSFGTDEDLASPDPVKLEKKASNLLRKKTTLLSQSRNEDEDYIFYRFQNEIRTLMLAQAL